MKKRILFFMANNWSFGRFINDLSKYLFQYNFDCTLLDYSVVYKYEEFHELAKLADWIVTTPSGVKALPSYGIPYEKMIMIMYHSVDVQDVRTFDIPINLIHRTCAINEHVKSLCYNFPVPVELVDFGINTNTFKATPSTELKRVGFSGVFLTREQTQKAIQENNFEPKIYKRGYLALEAAQITGLEFIPAMGQGLVPYQFMPGYYPSVDAILSCSIDEGASGSVLEGGAAGRLIITTNAGSWSNFVTDKGAHGLPVSDEEYLHSAVELLNYYKSNPTAYRNRCYEIQEYAQKKYDLSNYIYSWIRVLSGY